MKRAALALDRLRAFNATIAPGYVGLFWLAAGMTLLAVGASVWDVLRPR